MNATSSSTKNGLPPLRSSRSVDGLGVGVAVEQRAHELAGRVLVERIELERDAVVLARLGLPARLDVGARGRDEHERPVAQPGEQPFAELERVVGSPSADRRARARAAPSARALRGPRAPTAALRRGRGSGRRRAGVMPSSEVQQAFDDALELGRLGVGSRARCAVLLGDARLDVGLAVGARRRRARLAQRFGDRAERVRVAVGKALAGEHVRRRARTPRSRRARSRAGSCRRPRRRRGARGARARGVVAILASPRERRELGVAADERRLLRGPGAGRAGAGASSARNASTGSSRPRRP